MGTAAQKRAPGSPAGSAFGRVIVGIDGTEPSLEALRQALRLVDPAGRVELVCAVYLVEATLAGWSAVRITEELEQEAGEALRDAEALAAGRAAGKLVNGPPAKVLLREAERGGATLLALGTHGHSRASEILIGGVAGELLHDAPCSVLIARPPRDDVAFPRAIVVGLDGSPQSGAALDAALELRRRLDVPLRALVALRGKQVDAERARRLAPFAEVVDAHPVETLLGAAVEADLVVVGSRGLHGLRSLGSVGERVAHRARSSVLVVRRRGD